MSPADARVVQPALAAEAAGSLAELASSACRCVACPDLVAGRSRVVPGAFPPQAPVLFVGEAPGAQEDISGQPFVGKAGQLLDQLLAEVGLSRGRAAVTNVVKCRPPGNRTPRRSEVGNCRSWLDRQIELLQPAVVCTLGGTATSWALGPGTRLGQVRGAALPWRDRLLVATYHPSAAIRFGPAGAPLAALRVDLRTVADLVERLESGRETD